MIPKRFVTKRLRNKKVKFFILNKLKLSNAKVENVVKEPKNPITRKNLKTSFTKSLFCNKLIINPIKKHPIMLTIKIPTGN